MLLGPFSPDASWTAGPFGASGSGGGAPSSFGTVLTRSVLWSGIHWSSPSSTGFSSTPSMRRTLALPASPTHSSTASGVRFVKAYRRPSALQVGKETLAPAGSAISSCDPSATLVITYALPCRSPWMPWFRAITRTPPSRSIGWARSAIGGYRTGDIRIIQSRVGLIAANGGAGACSTSSTSCGGFW